ncbi:MULTISPECIES: hypothetical protein [Bacillaceae]|uniref:Uncharacterized protein n=3 Tax=Bacillaceae TaxID=186817 RepID=A0A9D5DP48_9BACI|nr:MULTISPECIES: hypothetical protein [Bacillaceae]KQL57671.1 hypothetical protein AN965_09315 [Alkalicoccobacillus plakortidis]MBG9784096.1 hypothetical protein [Shouchella lehensis]TES50921.1 hypothetical protein E2L03_03090 [Shouchella lehensis]
MTEERMNTLDKKIIQLNQKILHYRSEVVKQDRLLTDQRKRIHDQDTVIEELTLRLEELANDPAVSEVDSASKVEITPSLEEKDIQVDSFFTYAIMAPYETNEEEPFVIKGHMIIENRGASALNNPVICLSFNKPELANLSGRIERSKNNLQHYSVSREGVTDTWKFVEEQADRHAKQTGQFWLSPPIDTIPARSSITFSDFEVVIPAVKKNTSLSLQITGFVYGADLTEGKASLNTIALTVS